MPAPDTDPALLTQARTALAGVVDPELGLGIIDLGLVRALEVRGGTLVAALTPTSAACPMTDLIVDEARSALAAACPDHAVRLKLRRDPAWTPDWLSERARRTLGA